MDRHARTLFELMRTCVTKDVILPNLQFARTHGHNANIALSPFIRLLFGFVSRYSIYYRAGKDYHLVVSSKGRFRVTYHRRFQFSTAKKQSTNAEQSVAETDARNM